MVDRPKSGKPDQPLDRIRAINRMRGLTGREKSVAVAIAVFDGPGGAFPGVETLAEDTGTSVTSVKVALRGLTKKGLLTSKRRGRSNNSMRVLDYDWRPGIMMGWTPDHQDDGQEIGLSKPSPSTLDGPESEPMMVRKSDPEQEEQEKKRDDETAPIRSASPGASRIGAPKKAKTPAPEPLPDPAQDARKRLAAAETALAATSAGDVMRPAQMAIVARIKRELAELSKVG